MYREQILSFLWEYQAFVTNTQKTTVLVSEHTIWKRNLFNPVSNFEDSCNFITVTPDLGWLYHIASCMRSHAHRIEFLGRWLGVLWIDCKQKLHEIALIRVSIKSNWTPHPDPIPLYYSDLFILINIQSAISFKCFLLNCRGLTNHCILADFLACYARLHLFPAYRLAWHAHSLVVHL